MPRGRAPGAPWRRGDPSRLVDRHRVERDVGRDADALDRDVARREVLRDGELERRLLGRDVREDELDAAPLGKVCSPTSTARSWFLGAATTISLALAEEPLTKTTSGLGVSELLVSPF